MAQVGQLSKTYRAARAATWAILGKKAYKEKRNEKRASNIALWHKRHFEMLNRLGVLIS